MVKVLSEHFITGACHAPLTGLDGIVNVRFTIDGKRQKDFKGYIDMRETFIPDYFI